MLISAGERPGGVLAFDPHEGWVDFVVPVSRDERLWEGASVDDATGEPVSELGGRLEQRRGRPVGCLGAGMPNVASAAELEADLRYGPNHVRRRKDAVELARPPARATTAHRQHGAPSSTAPSGRAAR